LSTLWVGSGITRKYDIWLKRLPEDKHFGLIVQSDSAKQKKFYKIHGRKGQSEPFTLNRQFSQATEMML